MANIKITELTEIAAGSVTDSDVLPIDDADGGPAVTYKISIGRLRTKVISPSSNGAESCGTASLRWAAVYSQNLNVLSTSAPQAQLSYDASNHLQVSVSSAGAVTYNATGASAGHTFSDPVTLSSTLAVTGASTLSGTAYIGDTSNANVTLGLTINQGAADDHALALKSSDITHGVTGVAETDTYGYLAKSSGTDGGVAVVGLTEAALAVQISGVATTEITTKATTSLGNINVTALLKSGTGVGAHGANANLLTIQGGSDTRFIFDNEGSAHGDVEWIAF